MAGELTAPSPPSSLRTGMALLLLKRCQVTAARGNHRAGGQGWLVESREGDFLEPRDTLPLPPMIPQSQKDVQRVIVEVDYPRLRVLGCLLLEE